MRPDRISKLAKMMKHQGEKPSKKPTENLNSFLYKLWSLVNDETLSVIRWSQDGEKIIIDSPVKFTAKVLESSDRKVFKTKNISSFIRQLNLYGFRRVKENCGKNPLLFKHESFKRGRMDLLADVKRKKPVPNKLICTGGLTTPPQKILKSIVQAHDRNQVQNKPRYQFLPTAHSYPYLNPGPNLVRKNVHIPFITPFTVNHGPTFINLGSNSTIYGKHGEQDQARIGPRETQDGEKQPILQQPETNAASQKLDKTKGVTETFYPWHHHGYHAAHEPGSTSMNTAYGNEFGFQVMMHNPQIKYGNYTPPQSATNNIYSSRSLPPVTSYRNYGNTSESSTYYPGLANYAGPVNSIVPLPYRTPEHSHNNVPSQRSVLKSENLPSCSAFPEHAVNDSSNDDDDDDDARSQEYAMHGSTAFTYITDNAEKDGEEEKKT